MENLDKKQILEDELKHAEGINTEVKEDKECCCSKDTCTCNKTTTSEDDLL